MPSRKRNHDEIIDTPSQPQNLLTQIRNTWQFACLMQYIQFFGSALKIDNELDIDMLEEECLKPYSERLAMLGLTMLKWVSSHRGLTLDIFDEYTRRQYLARAPHLNPFGEEEDANKFSEFDIFTKLKVLHQLSVWTFHNPDRIRERMEESRDVEQAGWRIEPYGFDRLGRTFYLLDDNRLYRVTDPAPTKPTSKKAKAKTQPKKSGGRSSKRQKLANGTTLDQDDAEGADKDEHDIGYHDQNNELGGAKWECVAVSIEEFREIIEQFRKSKDIDEKDMARGLQDDVMPELEKAEESKARKEARRMKELENLQRMASAKRSSRIAGRQEKERQEAEVRAAELKRKQEVEMAHKEHERQIRAERDRESRMMTREQRIKDREMRRILHEEELERLEDRSQSVDSNEARISERNRRNLLEKKQHDLEKLKQEELEDWDFDCSVCGVHGKNIDDGTHSIACDKCGVWEHSVCHEITPQQAEQDDFKFVCDRCKRPKTGIKLKLPGQASPPTSTTSPTANNLLSRDANATAKTSPSSHLSAPPMGMFKPPSSSSGRPSSSGAQASAGQFHPPSIHNARPPSQGGYTPASAYPPMSTGPSLLPKHSSHTTANTSSTQPISNVPLYPQTSHQQPLSNANPTSRPSSGYQDQPGPSSSQPYPQDYNHQRSPLNHPPQPPINGTSQLPSHSPSPSKPAPSLSATQGNTDVHFSPTNQPAPASPTHYNPAVSFGSSSGAPQSYSPSSNRPAAGAFSPVKNASPRPSPSSIGHTHTTSGAPVASTYLTSPSKSHQPLPHTPSSQAIQEKAPLLTGAPTLSPSVNVSRMDNTPPVKKLTPSKFNGVSPVEVGQQATVNGVGHDDGTD